MSTDRQSMMGGYTFENGKFIPQGEMSLIDKKIRSMKLLAGSTETGEGEFYYDLANKEYWHYVQYDDYRTYLKPIKRSEIEEKYPSVDCDHLLDVKYE